MNSKFEELGFSTVTSDESPPPLLNSEQADAGALETALSLEYDLENSLLGNLDQLEKGLRLYEENGRPTS